MQTIRLKTYVERVLLAATLAVVTTACVTTDPVQNRNTDANAPNGLEGRLVRTERYYNDLRQAEWKCTYRVGNAQKIITSTTGCEQAVQIEK